MLGGGCVTQLACQTAHFCVVSLGDTCMRCGAWCEAGWCRAHDQRVGVACCRCCRVLKMNPQIDHHGPIMMPAGMDTFKSIGRPKGSQEGSVATGLAEWRELFAQMFPGAQRAAAARHTWRHPLCAQGAKGRRWRWGARVQRARVGR